MHITNQKLSFDIFMVGISPWNMILISNDYRTEKIYNFDAYNVLLAIAINIPPRLKTGFVHIIKKYHSYNRFYISCVP